MILSIAAPSYIPPPTKKYPKAFNANSSIKERLTTTLIKTAAAIPAILWLNYLFIFLYLTHDVPPQPCQKFKDSSC